MSKTGKESGLGRGLSALLGEQAGATGPADQLKAKQTLPIDLLQRNPEQPRRHFDEAELSVLAQSIRAQGILQPILVRPIVGTNQYQIVAGERRWRAAGQAGLRDIPVYVRELSDREVMEVALVENIQRADLNPMEEAQGYRVLIDQFKHTQEDVAQAIGRSRSHIANTVRLLELPAAVQTHVTEGQLSAGHARALLSATDPVSLAEQVIKLGLNVRQTEKWVRDSLQAPETKTRKQVSSRHKDPDIQALEAQISQNLGLQVTLHQKGPQDGVLSVEYQTLEQLDDLCRRLNTT
ncbi:MAG: ParB/RepB/Spo0J family partition protein [Robiginitomaculum sp.]|nr:ParB/RepB/Spo0J family partition protein [Robiginitomaculum sp.]